MFERQFGLRENPFAAGHQSRFVYPSREHQEALAHLRYGIENREPFVLITGEVGTGKTTALYDVLSEWQTRVTVALITNSALTRDELLEEICVRFGVGAASGITKPQLLLQLERHLLAVRARGDRAILLLDEAQNLHRDLLEEIRLLSNLEAQGDKLMQVFLVGQPELETLLSRPELRQLRQRIAVHYRLHPLSDDDTERYIHHRITVAGGHALTVFPAEACAVVHELTHGIPREINTVCSQAMLNAFVEDSGMVLPQHVRAVARDTEFQSVIRGGMRMAPDPAPPVAAPTGEPARPQPPAAEAPASESAEPAGEQPARPAPAVRAAGTTAQWEDVVGALGAGAGRPMPPPSAPMPPAPHANVAPAALTESPTGVSHESEEVTQHTRSSKSWYGPEPTPPSRSPLPPDEPVRMTAHAAPAFEPPPATLGPREVRPEPAQTSLPPSLRRKLEFEDDEAARPNGALRWIAFAGIAVVLIAAGFLISRVFSRSGDAASPREPAVTPVQNAPADSVAQPQAAQPPAAAPAEPISAPPDPRPAATPASKPPAATVERATQPRVEAPGSQAATKPPARSVPATIPSRAPDAAAKPAPTFAIAVGTFLDESRANQERDKIGAATGMAARVQPVTEGGDQMFRVVLGSFTDRAAAEKAAGSLIESGAVDEARIVSGR